MQEILDKEIKVVVNSADVTNIEEYPLVTTIPEFKKIITSSENPLSDFKASKTKVVAVHNTVLIQAQQIKEVIQKILIKDPTARCHSFPFIIALKNIEFLEKNGF